MTKWIIKSGLKCEDVATNKQMGRYDHKGPTI